MGLNTLLILGLAPQLLLAHPLEARQSVSCAFDVAANDGDTCATFAADWGLTESDFASINPGTTCPGNLVGGQEYCVIGTTAVSSTSTTTVPTTSKSTTASVAATSTKSSSVSVITKTTTTSKTTSVTTKPATSSTATKTTTKSTASTTSKTTAKPTSSSIKTTAKPTTTTSSNAHEPTQSGLSSSCNNFHLVASGDTCATIESKYSISASQFSSWNPSIDSKCDNLWLGYWVCVGIPGATKVTSSAKPTSTSNGPSPQMPSIVSSCDAWYKVASGDTCASIEKAKGITSAHFLSWNPYVDAKCDNLWLGYYVCSGSK